ncbi:hypothetical protein [Tenacibaculum haliotis]|uniref:hypothetical protein n=1 Tax=Tenacibaculum haliotis TaxID=1888914 RepID=UPI0021AFB30B|nr:hypothetical protein [Tenacibaculum haliotis]MCT4698494.1 hypothetical protein [Tenacibaculum haliotis]
MKRRHINILILVLVITVFGLQYYLITSYIEDMFQYTTIEVKNEVINNEIEQFKSYIIENFVILFLQSLGMFICLNIGFLYFKIKTSFRNILNLVVFIFLAVIIYQFLVIIIIKLNSWTFTMGSINTASEKLNLANYINDEKTAPWIELSLTSINLGQLMILTLLAIGIQKIIKIKYSRAFSITARTYGLSILLWLVFTMVMEMNFS